MTRDVTVVGAGGFGRECLDVLAAVEARTPGTFRVVGVVDSAPDELALDELRKGGVAWLGTVEDWLRTSPSSAFVVAIGSPEVRARIVRQLENAGLEPATAVHPSAVLGSRSVPGPGSVICAGTQISTNVRLGRHVHVNPNATVGHDAVVSDFVSVNPGAVISGAVRISSRVLVGAGAVVLQGLALGEGATVGAASCVTRDVAPHRVVMGVPAR